MAPDAAPDPYWDEFECEVYFSEPGDQVLGVVRDRGSARDASTGQKVPRILLDTPVGPRSVTAYAARLRVELLALKPQIGETLFIRYVGDDKRVAPGMKPSKLFRVKVDQPEPEGEI